jgi:Tuberculosis necrotizing toxin
VRRIITALAAVAVLVLSTAAPALAATAPKTAQSDQCSASYIDGDYRLGPATTPTEGTVAFELIGYNRFDGLSPQRFIADYWNSATGSWNYPPDNGYLIVNGQPVEFQETLVPGQSIDRFGSLYGSFLAPFGTPYAERSIPPSSLDDAPSFTCNYHTYKVDKPFTVEAGPIAPAFGQPGFGLQYQLVASLLPGDPSTANVYWLVDNGYLTATN